MFKCSVKKITLGCLAALFALGAPAHVFTEHIQPAPIDLTDCAYLLDDGRTHNDPDGETHPRHAHVEQGSPLSHHGPTDERDEHDLSTHKIVILRVGASGPSLNAVAAPVAFVPNSTKAIAASDQCAVLECTHHRISYHRRGPPLS
jgi:hypothetical protein